MAIEVVIRKLHSGYKLIIYPQRSLVLTAQQLRNIYNWWLLHIQELEAEAKAAEHQKKDR